MRIKCELTKEQAEHLRKFLRRVNPKVLETIHDELDWSTFDKAATVLRLAIMDALEPEAS